MKCPKCQFENPEGKKFCGQCGAKMERICPQCNASNPPQFNFCGECGHNLTEPTEPEKKALAFDSERKHATVLFSDLVGYTAMTERLDPEDVKEIMSRIFGEIAQLVRIGARLYKQSNISQNFLFLVADRPYACSTAL